MIRMRKKNLRDRRSFELGDVTGLTVLHLASQYNEGQSIHYFINFHAQLPPLEPNEKAHVPAINRIFYTHESSSLVEVLDAAISIVGRNDQSLPFKIVGKDLRTSKFSVTYTISRTNLKKMQLGSDNDFKVMLDAAVLKGKPEAKLEITESLLRSRSAVMTTGKRHRANARFRRRRKNRPKLSYKFKALTVVPIVPAHPDFCFEGNPTAHQLAKMDGVDVQTPPPPEEEKMFWPVQKHTGGEPDDIAMLARRRVAANRSQSSPNVTINTITLTDSDHPCQCASHSNISASPAKPARMTMIAFCTAFDLSDDIVQRLVPLEMDGPHLLDFIEIVFSIST
ncbi:hypothetical protein B0H17DRAFT_1189169 [Mycena rosella]|uniref:Uncharacterized protein n=1 Tax=Mycena rosella TaxID=1033263 RepID=A0AAD7B784_MYCRO|nr:hypothetical protein B0H17DRAFT_1189169 [Mycena rosella]